MCRERFRYWYLTKNAKKYVKFNLSASLSRIKSDMFASFEHRSRNEIKSISRRTWLFAKRERRLEAKSTNKQIRR